jgi:predicted transcriptional regulator
MNTEETSPHLTATIVSSYVRHNTVGANQLSDLITTVHRAIGQLGQPVQPEEVLVPAVSVRRSVHHDYVVCLDCGYRGKTLRRHIRVRHGLTRDEYLRRWGLPSHHRLTAPAYSNRRSEMAKSIGLGRKPKSAVTSAVSSKAATPTRERRSAAAAKSVDVANEAVALTPARRGRPRSRIAQA